jgi:hypothetical protein
MPLPVDNQLPHVVPVANLSRHRFVARLAAAGRMLRPRSSPFQARLDAPPKSSR